MRKISEMYRRSGGTSYHHICSECVSFISGKHSVCKNYGAEVPWKGNYPACKFYNLEDNEQLTGQMDIFDLLKA